MKNLINPGIKVEHEPVSGCLVNLLTCKVYQHCDGEEQIVVSGDPKRREGVVLARIPRMGDRDKETILAANIAYAMNFERGQL